MLTQRLADDVEATRERRVPKGASCLTRRFSSNRSCEGLFGVDEVGLGLRQSCGQSGNRLTGSLHGSSPSPKIKTHRAGFRSLRPHPMSDRLFGVLRNECLELALCPLMVEKGTAGAAKQRGKLRPGIRRAHVDDADRLDTRPRRLRINEVGSFARLNASPEFLFCRYQDRQ